MMTLPTPKIAYNAAVKSASLARVAAAMAGGAMTEKTNHKLGLVLAYANAGRFEDAYRRIDELADVQLAWAPCMLILRAAQAAYGNSAGPAGVPAPCEQCGTRKPAVFSGEALCLTCLEAPPEASTVERVGQR